MEQLMLLDITKLKPEVADVVVQEVQLDAKMRQAAIWAVERDESIPRAEQVKTVKGMLGADMRFLLDMINAHGELGEHLHGAAHEMIDHCNEQARRDRESGEHGGACKTVVWSFAQMVCLGYRLANAQLQNEVLEKSAV